MFTIDIEYTHVAFLLIHLLLYGDRRLTQELSYLPTYLPVGGKRKYVYTISCHLQVFYFSSFV